ncbi:TetR/AcrR family transcriptional regulator [Demequina sediminicola]|uniref:TetR/AcrR family transcriptional regulator n=1 Tax=Demequina sediminicola TaxID=1095026 RepID=UPI0007824CFA|nr:TetR/AcrR family transcriptional regulator [Demequina sediminicola]
MNQRRDARSNYQALLTAAEAVFAEGSVNAPLQLVAERAGVGRGTLYRHFPHRQALAAAIYRERLTGLETLVANEGNDPHVALTLLTAVAEQQNRIPGLFNLIFNTDSDSGELEPLWRRSIILFGKPLKISQQAGVLRNDLTVDDLLMVVGMVYGVLNSPAGMNNPDAAQKALDIALLGLRPR